MQYDARVSRPLSTTAYAVLGMLALRPATPYELTQQMQRSLDYLWTTSERSLYDQPERLVAAGLAEVSTEGDGAGDRRRYAITPAGREALEAWLSTEAATPRFQIESLLRVLFADQGEVDDLRSVLAGLREHTAERRRLGHDQLRTYLDDEGLFQERAHIVVLVGDLVARMLDLLDDWAAEVEDLTAGWESTAGIGLSPEVRDVLVAMLEREAVRVEADRVAGRGSG